MSIDFDSREKLWVERYRPNIIDDCILPDRIKKQFKEIVDTKHIPNLLLHGGAGVGKTTVAKALCKELGVDWIVINCSEETGIDVLRSKIRDFASTVSFSDNGKCIILDEFDYSSTNLQAGLRNAMESFSKTCSFIMTCNYANRVIDPIHSRSVSIEFDFGSEEKIQLQAQFFKRILDILKNENITADQKAVITLIQKFFPDNRRILNQLQQYSRSGSIDAGILVDLEEVSIDGVINAMKNKSFKDVRQWCADNAHNDLKGVYTKLYRRARDLMEPASIPEFILILEDYQRFDSTVPDRELHMAAMCVQVMMTVSFK